MAAQVLAQVGGHALAAAGLATALLAGVAWVGDRRRMRRRDLDKVGVMPWTLVFFLSLLAACVLLGLAVRQAIAG